MIYEGKFEKVVSSTTGQRKDGEGEWKKVQFLVKSNKSTCFIAWTKEAEFVLGLKSGDSITVEFEIESREYNGKWYSDVKATKVYMSAQTYKTPLQQKQEAKAEESADDLPF